VALSRSCTKAPESSFSPGDPESSPEASSAYAPKCVEGVFSETHIQPVAFLSNRTGAEPCNLRYPSRPARRLSDGLYVPLAGKRKGRSFYYAPALVFSAKCRGYLPSEPHLWNISPAFSVEVTGWASTLQVS
jgi:hypothetical protein